MIVHDLVGTEDNPAYRILEAQNLIRQYDFTHSIYQAANSLNQHGLSQEKLKALNFHGIACLHGFAGQYRPHDVVITNALHRPPPFQQVNELMIAFISETNHLWARIEPITLAAFVLWRLNWIHPFVNGNGRTARVTRIDQTK
jgi:Fic family protein